MTIPPSVIGENFESTGAILEVYGVAGAEIVLETVVSPDGSAESVSFRRFGSDENYGLHISSVCSWKTQARMTLAAKVDLTPEEFGRRGQFYFGLSAFEGFEFTDAFTG